MKERNKKILFGILFVLGLCFCIVGVMGHNEGWTAAALSFFAAVMTVVGQKNEKDKK